MCADFAIHDKGDGNPHAHIMLTMRPLKANHQSQQFRLEDNLLKYFSEKIERNKGFIKGLEMDIATLEAHPHPEAGVQRPMPLYHSVSVWGMVQ